MVELSSPARRLDPVRWLARVLCLVFGLVGALPLGLEALLQLPPIQAWAARTTTDLLHRELAVAAQYRVELHVIPLRLTLRDVVVPSNDGGPAAFTATRLRVSPRLLSLLAGRIDLGQVEAESPRARLIVRDGQLKNVN